jgi:hypothetical protein
MRYFRTAAFKRAYRGLGEPRQQRGDVTLLKLAEAFETGSIPHGLGLKPLRHGIWEARSGILDRILFRREPDDVVELLLIGTHEEIKRFLKHTK